MIFSLAIFSELSGNDLVEEIPGNYSRKGIQLGSIIIPYKSSHSGRNASIVVAAGERNRMQISNFPTA